MTDSMTTTIQIQIRGSKMQVIQKATHNHRSYSRMWLQLIQTTGVCVSDFALNIAVCYLGESKSETPYSPTLSQVSPPAREWSDSGVYGGAVLQTEVQPAAEVPSPALSPGGPGAETHLPAPRGKRTHHALPHRH